MQMQNRQLRQSSIKQKGESLNIHRAGNPPDRQVWTGETKQQQRTCRGEVDR